MDALNTAILRSKIAGRGNGHSYIPPIPAAVPEPPKPSVDELIVQHMRPLLARIAHLEQRINAAELNRAVPSDETETPDKPKPKPKIDTIITETEREFDLSGGQIKSEFRRAEFVLPRHVAMYLACRLTLRSLPQIGAVFGGRDHSTVIHGRDVIIERRKTDAELDRKISNIERVLAG